jgi:hypothetical protein
MDRMKRHVRRHILGRTFWALNVSLALSLASGCSDVVSSRYATRAEYDQAPGWLPEIIPASSRNIEQNNNLDLNTSWGRFAFDRREARDFFERLDPGPPTNTPFSDFDDALEDARNESLSVWSYTAENTVWTFICDMREPSCEYLSWPADRNPQVEQPYRDLSVGITTERTRIGA